MRNPLSIFILWFEANMFQKKSYSGIMGHTKGDYHYAVCDSATFPLSWGCDAETSKEHPGELVEIIQYQAAHVCASKLTHRCCQLADGDHLLQTVVWPQQSTYDEVCQVYISYILKHYGLKCTVVFDGYGNISSTTAAEQRRRAQKCTSSDIIFYLNMPTASFQAAFLTNGNNKKGWSTSFEKWCLWPGFMWSRLRVMQTHWLCPQTTALALSQSEGLPVVVAGRDTDFLVMLVAQATPHVPRYIICCAPTTPQRCTTSVKFSILSEKPASTCVCNLPSGQTQSIQHGAQTKW